MKEILITNKMNPCLESKLTTLSLAYMDADRTRELPPLRAGKGPSTASGNVNANANTSASDFVKGFITGQLALLGLLVVIVRFLFFRNSHATTTPHGASVRIDATELAAIRRRRRESLPSSLSTLFQRTDSDSATGTGEQDAELLERLLGIDAATLKTGQPVVVSEEPAAWLNFAVAKLLVRPLMLPLTHDRAMLRSTLAAKLNALLVERSELAAFAPFLAPIHVKGLDIDAHELAPSLGPLQVVWERGGAVLRIGVSWCHPLRVEVETALQALPLAGVPLPLVALPVAVSVNVREVRGTLQLQLRTTSEQRGIAVALSCLPDDRLLIDCDVGSLVGHRSKLKDLPRITTAFKDALKKLLLQHLIHPRCIELPLPWDSALDVPLCTLHQ
jgi:hypothetical protein